MKPREHRPDMQTTRLLVSTAISQRIVVNAQPEQEGHRPALLRLDNPVFHAFTIFPNVCGGSRVD